TGRPRTWRFTASLILRELACEGLGDMGWGGNWWMEVSSSASRIHFRRRLRDRIFWLAGTSEAASSVSIGQCFECEDVIVHTVYKLPLDPSKKLCQEVVHAPAFFACAVTLLQLNKKKVKARRK